MTAFLKDENFPCDLVATASLTLSGLQTIDSVAATDGMIVLCTAQNGMDLSPDPTLNGPYIVRVGAWDKITSLASGQQFYIRLGTVGAKTMYQLQSVEPFSAGYTFAKISSGTANSFNPASPGPIGGTTPSTGTFISVQTNDTSEFPNVTLDNSGSPPGTGKTNICTYSSGKGLGIVTGTGNAVALANTATDGTSSTSIDVFTFSLTNNSTYDYAPGNGGTMLVAIPGASSCPMAHVGFAANGATTLNGVTPAGGISLTTDNATTLNIYASGGNVRFQNKVGSTISVLVQAVHLVFV